MAATRSVVALVLLVAAGCTDDDDLAGELPAATQVAAITTVTEPVTTTSVPAATTLPLVLATAQHATTSPALPVTTAAAAAACPALTPGVNDIELTAGGATHPVRVFVPSAYTGAPLPVVIDWHGLGSTGPQQAMYSGYESLAESEGFIVVHPTGVANVAGGPNSWQLFPAPDGARDDVAFAGALIDELANSWCADPARVYSTGMSNGGFFTARLICEMSHRIAAAVSVAGTYHPESCEPARDVPYVAIHGTEDRVVPYAGGDSTLSSPDSPEELRVFFESVIPEEFNEFAGDAGCDANINTDVGDDVIRHEYTGCDGDAPLIFFEVRGGGHTWPASPMAALTSGALGYTTDDIDATRDGWEFMSQYTLAGV